MLFLLKLTVVAALNYLMNIFFLKKNFILDDINSSFHKKFTNSKRVPLSGGVVFIILFLETILINGPPIIKTTINEVKTAKPVLNVIYLNTFKKLKISTNSNKKL